MTLEINHRDQQFLLETLRRLFAQLPVTRRELSRAIDIVSVQHLTEKEAAVLQLVRSDRRALVKAHHTTIKSLLARGLLTPEGDLTPEGKCCSLKK